MAHSDQKTHWLSINLYIIWRINKPNYLLFCININSKRYILLLMTGYGYFESWFQVNLLKPPKLSTVQTILLYTFELASFASLPFLIDLSQGTFVFVFFLCICICFLSDRLVNGTGNGYRQESQYLVTALKQPVHYLSNYHPFYQIIIHTSLVSSIENIEIGKSASLHLPVLFLRVLSSF